MKRKNKAITILLLILGGLLIMAIGGAIAYLMWEKPPALQMKPEEVTPVVEATPSAEPEPTAPPTPPPAPQAGGTAGL